MPEKHLLEKAVTIWIFSVRQRIEKANKCCRKTVSKIRQCFWI